MGSDLVIERSIGLNLLLDISQGQEPVLVQTLLPESTIVGLHGRIVGRLARVAGA